MSRITKRCTRCHEEKSVLAFGRRLKSLSPSCRICSRELLKTSRANNDPDKMAAQRKRYRKPERDKPALDAWRIRNADHIRQYRRTYAQDHPEVKRASEARRRQQGKLTTEDRRISTAYRIAIRNDLCFYCQDPGAEDDHYFPLSKGGDDRWYNLVRACVKCNRSKYNECGTYWLLKCKTTRSPGTTEIQASEPRTFFATR